MSEVEEVQEVQIEKPKGKNKWLVVIIVAGGLIFIGISLFFLIGKTGGKMDYSLIPVCNIDNKWGYVDKKGVYVINPQFEVADFFSKDGLAKIKLGGKTGYINKKGEYVIPANYKNGTAFGDGLAFVVMEGGLPTCIDKKGDTKFELSIAGWVSAFSEGLAIFVTENGEYGFIDKTGNIAINAQFERAMPFKGNFARIWQNGDAGFIDKTGTIVINPQFNEIGNFYEEKAAFSNGKEWGYTNPKGTYAINPQFDNAGMFSHGLAAVRQGRTHGYIDKEGKLKINPQFDKASPFSEGLAAVQVSGGKYAYINLEGKYEINPQFEDAKDFHNGVALVRSANKWGFINKKGQYVVNPMFQQVKLEESDDVYPEFVENDFYDTSEFLNQFFEREAGNTFDGVNASSTLEILSEHPIYGAGLNANNPNSADYSKPISITKEISIRNIIFKFNNSPIYEYENNSYNRTQKWDFSATPDAIVYQFELVGKAYEKRSVVISALRSEIERRQGQSMGIDGDNYFLLQDNGRLSYAIMGSELTIAFSKDFFSKIPKTQNQQLEGGDVSIPKTTVRTSDDIYNNYPRISSVERNALKIDRFNNNYIRKANNSDLIKGDNIYQNQSGSLAIIYLIKRDNGTGLWAFLVSYDSSGNYIDNLMVAGSWIESELHSSAVIEGNKIVITYYSYDDNIPNSEFVIKSDLSFVKIK